MLYILQIFTNTYFYHSFKKTVMHRNLKISSKKESLKAIRTFVSEALEELSISDVESNMLILAVDEICANRIIHSHSLDNNSFLEIVIRIEANQEIVFEIIDSGIPYDPTTHQEANLIQLIQSKRKGGIGLTLVKKIMDTIEVSTINNLSIFRMQKKLPLAS
ncbi:MAG: ATP-binding protein [Cytophagales bacterium]|nr:MAG: ATP-binding protein [Cytophagales bacterium]